MFTEDHHFCVALQANSQLAMSFSEPSTSRSNTDDRLLEDAFQLKLLATSMDSTDILKAVGVDLERPDFQDLTRKLRDRIIAHSQQHGMPSQGTDVYSMVTRAAKMLLLMKYNPDSKTGGFIKLTHTMKLAGFNKTESKSASPEYMRCFRKVGALKAQKEKRRAEAATRAAEARARAPQQESVPPPRIPNLSVPLTDDGSEQPSLSPLTQDSNNALLSSDDEESENGSTRNNGDNEKDTDTEEEGASSSLGATTVPDDFEENQCVWPIPFPDEFKRESMENGKCLTSVASLSSRSKPKTIQSLTTTTAARNTTHAAQRERQELLEGQSMRTSLYKSATTLCAAVVRQENTLTNFATPEQVATAFNIMSGIDMLSGNELRAAVRTGNIGKSPPRRGRISSVPAAEFDAFCDAAYTFSAIEQINCTSRTKKAEIQSLVGEVLNAKRKEDGDDGKAFRAWTTNRWRL